MSSISAKSRKKKGLVRPDPLVDVIVQPSYAVVPFSDLDYDESYPRLFVLLLGPAGISNGRFAFNFIIDICGKVQHIENTDPFNFNLTVNGGPIFPIYGG